MISTLNDLEVKPSDVLNVYVQAPVTEKVWTALVPQLSKDTKKTAAIVRALYGLKSAGAVLEAMLLSAWNPWGISLLRLTWIYVSNQKSDQKVGYSITRIYCVIWMAFYVSITIQMQC